MTGRGPLSPMRPVGNPLGPKSFPLYRYGWAPRGLATRRQLRARGLRPGRREPMGRIVWCRGRRWADLYEIAAAKPVRPMTPARAAALANAMTARRTCPQCGCDVGYCLPTRWGICVDCHDGPWPDSNLNPDAAPTGINDHDDKHERIAS